MAYRGQGPALGIDLGTTYSCAGVWRNGKVEIVPNEQGNHITPSCVAFKGDERLVGDGAKNLAAANPSNTIFDAKRLIGRRFRDNTVQEDMSLWPFRVAAGEDDRPMIVVRYKGEEKYFAAEGISAMVLAKMKVIAETFLGRAIPNAVVTVPAYFNDSQRRCTKDAGTIAGLNVMRIINEPTAAALAYGFDMSQAIKKKVLIFDLGGGTFDVSVLKIQNGVVEVKATAGDTHLGGQDFDNRMLSKLCEEFKIRYGKDISANSRAKSRLRSACEKAKRNLSFTPVATVEVDCLCDDTDFYTSFSRAKFEDLNKDLFEKCIGIVRECLRDARMEKGEVDEVVLVGGSTRIPMGQEMLRGFFDGKALCNSLHVDEAVAYGATVQAAMLVGEGSLVQQMVLKDVTPISLGMENKDGLMCVFIPKNTPIPTSVERNWTTTADYMTRIRIDVYEGERSMTMDNNLIGSFTLGGIAQALAYVPMIRVVSSLDENGLLTISAKDLASGSEAAATITNEDGRLKQEDISRMIADAERYKEEDERARRQALARSELERFAYLTRNTAREPGTAQRMQAGDRDRVEKAVAETIQWSERNAGVAAEEDYHDKKVVLQQLWDSIKTKYHLGN